MFLEKGDLKIRRTTLDDCFCVYDPELLVLRLRSYNPGHNILEFHWNILGKFRFTTSKVVLDT